MSNLADAFMAVFGFKRIASQNGNVITPAAFEAFRCRRCGATGEEKFSWDGYCLMCEDADGNDCVRLAGQVHAAPAGWSSP